MSLSESQPLSPAALFCMPGIVCHFHNVKKLLIPPKMVDRQNCLKALAAYSLLKLSCIILTRAFNADLTTL